MNPLQATEGLSYPLPTSQKKPTVIFIPSTFHTPAHFGPISWYLETQGSSSFALRMPSSTGEKAETSSSSSSGGGDGGMMVEDVATIRRVLEELVLKNEEDVVLVMHAYGAVPGCQAVTAGLEHAGRVIEGKVGGVTGLVFICGWLVKEGESIESTMLGLGEKALPEYAELENTSILHPPNHPPSSLFDDDLPPQKATYWTSQLSPQHSLDIYTTPVQTTPCWDTTKMPITYIACARDPHARITDGMLAESKREEWTVKTIEAGHAPFLSRVEEVGDLILEAGKGKERVGGGGGWG